MNLMNGWVIISIMIVFFASMYAYSYLSVYYEKKKLRDEIEQKRHAEQLLQEEKQQKRQLINEKFQKIKDRSTEIKRELKRLEEMKKARLRTQGNLS